MRLAVPLVSKRIRWAWVGVIAAFIFYFSVLTAPPRTPVDTARFSLIPLDRWRHIVAYAGLAGAVVYSIADQELKPTYAVTVIFCSVFLYGVGIELIQALTPERYFSLGDMYANAIGSALVAPLYLIQPYLRFVSVKSVLLK